MSRKRKLTLPAHRGDLRRLILREVGGSSRVELEESDNAPYICEVSYTFPIAKVGVDWIANNLIEENTKNVFYGDVYSDVFHGHPISEYFDYITPIGR